MESISRHFNAALDHDYVSANADSNRNKNHNNNMNNHHNVSAKSQQLSEDSSLWSSGRVSSSVGTHYTGSVSDEMAIHNSPAREGMGSIPLQPGESMYEIERPTSAPPPPGFSSGPEERNRLAEELLWGGSSQLLSGVGLGNLVRDNQHRLQNHHNASNPHDVKSSFTTLAAVLGTGLAESMEDATTELMNPHGEPSTLVANAPAFHPKDDLNFHRQTRHAASRLIGAPSTTTTTSSQNHSHFQAGQNKPPNQNDHFSSYPHPSPARVVPGGGLFPQDNYSRAPGQQQQVAAAVPVSRGFPSSLSSPQRQTSDDHSEKREALRGATTPVQLVPGQHIGERRNLPLSKDIGTKVVEPEGDHQFSNLSGIISSQRMDKNNPWSLDAQEFKPASMQNPNDEGDGNSSISDSVGGVTDVSPRQAEMELRHFLWDIDRNQPSRTLALLHISWLRAPDVRSACEAYGVVENFRADFSQKGIYFCSYYDIRSAKYAAVELQSVLQRMLILQRSSEEVVVRYCLPLNSSGQFDESQIFISDLPPEVDENLLTIMLSSYGAIRSVVAQGANSYIVEFQNVQDAKQALLELESSQPWGPDISVEMGVRNPVERKRGRELLAMIGRWRQGINKQSGGSQSGPPVNQAPMDSGYPGHQHPHQQQQPSFSNNVPGGNDPWRSVEPGSSQPVMLAPVEVSAFGSYGANQVAGYAGAGMRQNGTQQVVLGPDGRYQLLATPQYAVMDQQPRQQQIIQGPNGQLYVTAVPMNQNVFANQGSSFRPVQAGGFGGQGGGGVMPGQFGNPRAAPNNAPYYAHVIPSDANSVASGRSGLSYRSLQSNPEDKDTRHLVMDLDAVEAGRDSRTSLMVRNIPNKYTQQMLLAEFEEFGHGPGVIDFFYLPIDFKNRCNRGYAFINFVDYKDILPFHRRYFGKHWRTFNSDKICDITYARIQGKAAMLKRFENSALMEKDDEYKPLVFVSAGPTKGQRLPFPGILGAPKGP